MIPHQISMKLASNIKNKNLKYDIFGVDSDDEVDTPTTENSKSEEILDKQPRRAKGGGCGVDGALKPKAFGVKMLKLFSARVLRPTIKSISWSGLKLTVKYTVCIISLCD